MIRWFSFLCCHCQAFFDACAYRRYASISRSLLPDHRSLLTLTHTSGILSSSISGKKWFRSACLVRIRYTSVHLSPPQFTKPYTLHPEPCWTVQTILFQNIQMIQHVERQKRICYLLKILVLEILRTDGEVLFLVYRPPRSHTQSSRCSVREVRCVQRICIHVCAMTDCIHDSLTQNFAG